MKCYYSVQNYWIIEMKKCEDTIDNENENEKNIVNKNCVLFIANKLFVTNIYHKFTNEKRKLISSSCSVNNEFGDNLMYVVGKIIDSDKGVKYYKSIEPCLYDFDIGSDEKYNGVVRSYHQNGVKFTETNYIYGKANGYCYSWYDTEAINEKILYINNIVVDYISYDKLGNITCTKF